MTSFKQLFLFFLAFIIISDLCAQSEYQTDIDVLVTKINEEEDSLHRLELLDELGDFLPLETTELSLELCTKGISLCHKYGHYEKQVYFQIGKGIYYERLSDYVNAEKQYDTILQIGRLLQSHKFIVKGYYFLGSVNLITGDFPTSKTFLDSAVGYMEQHNFESSEKGRILYRLAYLQFVAGDFKESIQAYKDVIKNDVDPSDKRLLIDIYRGIGTSYSNMGEYLNAIEYLLQSASIAEEIGNKRKQSSALNDIGTTYLSMQNYDEAEKYLKKSLLIKEELNSLKGIAATYQNLGSVEYKRKNYKNAMEYYEKALKIRKDIGVEDGVTVLLASIAAVHHDEGDHEKALEQYNFALEKAIKEGRKELESVILVNLSALANDKEEFIEALKIGKECLNISQKINHRLNILNAHINLSHAFAALDDFENAFYHMAQAKIYNDSLSDNEATIEIGRLESQYQLESKQKELNLLKTQKELVDDKNTLLILIITLLFILGLILFYTISKRNKMKVSQLAVEKKLIVSEKELTEERLKNEKLQKVEYKQQLDEITKAMLQKNEAFGKLEKDLEQMKVEKFSQLTKENKSVTETVLKVSQSKEDWNTFMEYFQKNYHDYLDRLKSEFNDLTPYELRLCALLKINLSTKEIATLLNIAPASLRTSKYRLRKKLALEEKTNLSDFLLIY